MVFRKVSHSWWRGDASDQLAIEIVQRRKQRECPVSDIVMGFGLDMANAEWQTGLGAFQRLALRLLIAAEDQSFFRRIEIEPDHVPELALKLLVRGELEGPRQMRFDVVG